MLSGIVEGFASNALWKSFGVIGAGLRGGSIQITSPQIGGPLEEDPQPHGDGTSYVVRGKLRRLPNNQKIWLLRQDANSQLVYPQGFASVVFHPRTGEWSGRFNGNPQTSCTIVAVVAPPTSHDFFSYYQRVGHLTRFTALVSGAK